MGYTDNGYSAPPAEGIRPCGYDGAFAVPGVKDWDPAYEVFYYLMENFDTRVEWLRPGWCWGYAFRANANSPNSLSRHSGAIAIDLNAPLHPNGVPTSRVFTPGQIAAINVILDEIKCTCHNERVLRWGGDYTGTPDAMHFELNRPATCVASAAKALKEGQNMAISDEDLKAITTIVRDQLRPVKVANRQHVQRIMDMERAAAKADKLQTRLLKLLVKDMRDDNAAAVAEAAEELEQSANRRLAFIEKAEAEPDHDEA